MKIVWLAIVSACALAALSIPAFAQADAEASQAEAVRQFPDLAKAGSDFNKAFVARLQAARAAKDPTLYRSDWPMILAGAVAKELGLKPIEPEKKMVAPNDPLAPPPATKPDDPLPGFPEDPTNEDKLEGFFGIKWGATMDEVKTIMLGRAGVTLDSKPGYPLEAASLCKFAVLTSIAVVNRSSRASNNATADCLAFLGGTVAGRKAERIYLIFVGGKFQLAKISFPRDGNGESGNGYRALCDVLGKKYGKESRPEVTSEDFLGGATFEDGSRENSNGVSWKFRGDTEQSLV